jgi:hypothetical protein
MRLDHPKIDFMTFFGVLEQPNYFRLHDLFWSIRTTKLQYIRRLGDNHKSVLSYISPTLSPDDMCAYMYETDVIVS